MKKILPVLFVMISVLAFSGCAEKLPEVSQAEATRSLTAATAAYISGVAISGSDTTEAGITVTSTDTKTEIKFTAYNLPAEASPYTSISGSITMIRTSATSASFEMHFTFTGGEVVTMDIVIDTNGNVVFDVNGHDMLTPELKLTLQATFTFR